MPRRKNGRICRWATSNASILRGAVEPILNRPRFRVHRLEFFTPRSLDVDVNYD